MPCTSQLSARLTASVIAVAAILSPTAGMSKPPLGAPAPTINLPKPTVNVTKPAVAAATTKPATATPSQAQQAAALSVQEHEYISVNSLKQFEQIAARLGTSVQGAIVLNKEFGPGPGDPTRIVEKNIHKSPSSAAYCKNGVVANYGINPGISPGGVVMNPNGMVSGALHGAGRSDRRLGLYLRIAHTLVIAGTTLCRPGDRPFHVAWRSVGFGRMADVVEPQQSGYLGATQGWNHLLGEQLDRANAVLVDSAAKDRQKVASAGGPALRDDLVSDLGRCAGDEFVGMHRESAARLGSIQQRGGMLHARISREHLCRHLPCDSRSFLRLRLARRDGNVAADGEVIGAASEAKPVGLGPIGIEDLLDACHGFEGRADFRFPCGRLDGRGRTDDRGPFGRRGLL